MADLPMDAAPLIDVLSSVLPGGAVTAGASADGMPTLVTGPDALIDVCRAMRNHPALQFGFLAEVTAVDYAPREPRFEVIYHLACLGHHYVVPEAGPAPATARRARIRVALPGEDPRVPTVTGVWPAANWLEREVFDMFGISFEGHPDLRRVLMPDDWVGHPLRRDYPVQIKKETASWSPLQISVEEFAASVRARQAMAGRQAGPAPSKADRE